MKMNTIEDLRHTVGHVEYKDKTGVVTGEMGNGYFLQHIQEIPDCTSDSDETTIQKGRKWYVSKHATQSEVFQTCLAAVIAFEEHEARECFRVAGKAIFGPHIDTLELINVADKKDAR